MRWSPYGTQWVEYIDSKFHAVGTDLIVMYANTCDTPFDPNEESAVMQAAIELHRPLTG